MAVCEGNLSYGCGILFWLQNWIPELGPLVEFATRELNGKDLTKTITELVVHEGGSNSDYLGSSLMRTLKLKDPHKNLRTYDQSQKGKRDPTTSGRNNS